MTRSPHVIIIRPHISERTVSLSYGDPNKPAEEVQRKYTFEVLKDANKVEIKRAIEAIYNAGKSKKDAAIVVEKVHTITVRGKRKRVNSRTPGKTPDWKKAIITLAKGQMLEDYGV
ncbi:MAG: 50S ribosomal protein L23 [Chthonomonas sp.]|nr:50S ribosomal protein L23 [Chthonomonas sp.]